MNTILLQDIRYALRQLRRAPGFTLSVMLVLGLGIGANAAIFSILNVTLLQRLPFADPKQLVTLQPVDVRGTPALAMLPDTLDWQKQSHTLTDLAYYDPGTAYLAAPSGDQRVSATVISPNLLATLGVAPALGRGFTTEEQQPGHDNVVLLSDAIWRNLYHADPQIVGKTVSIEGTPLVVIGVMPARFAFPLGDRLPQLWRPVALKPALLARHFDSESYDAIARMKPGTMPAAIQSELSSIQARLKPLYSGGIASLIATGVEVKPYRASINADQRPALLTLLAAIGVIWLIACANAANLMLTRGAARRRELAVRGALGASRARIVRQLLTESLLLAVGSAAVGLLLGAATLRLFAHALLQQLSLTQPPAFDLPVLAALLVLTLISTLLVGLVPALLATNTPIEQALRHDGAQSGSSRSRNRLQRALVVVEIALSLTLLVACGLLLRTVFALHKVPLGFRTDHIVLVKPSVPAYKHKATGLTQSVYLPLLERVRTMHGVQAAALTTVVPLDKSFQMSTTMSMWKADGDPKNAARIDLQMRASTPDLQKVFGFRVIEGRYFNADDTPDSAPVLVVNEAFARAYKAVQGKSIVGNFSFGSNGGKPARAIGIVQDFRQVGVDKPAAPEIDLLASQMPLTESTSLGLDSHLQLVIRTSEPTAVFLPDLRRVLADTSPDLRTAAISTMDQVVEDSLGPQALAAHLLEALGGLALLVALAGLYSLLAYMVTLRTQELGIRIALGADRMHIVGLVLSHAAVLVVVGIGAGTAISLVAAHLIEHFLFGVRPHDALTLATSAALMLAVSLLAAWLPARRAASIDPIQALRTE